MIDKVLENLRKNRMEAYFVERREDVVPLVKTLIQEGNTVGLGGSVTLQESGIVDLLRSGVYHFLDRARPGITPEEVRKVYCDTFAADAFFCSANAITEQGELFNVDGNCNRIAAISFGPKSVIVVAGINKIVPDLDAAIQRVKTVAAPKNTKRLSCKTYCNEKGVCMGAGGDMTAGCASADRICCTYMVCGPQRIANRIKVILVNEELGY